MAENVIEDRVASIRSFNRFFTRQIGVLREGLLHTPYSLAEARILYELAHRQPASASELCSELGLDPSYVSRIVSRLEQKSLIVKSRSKADARRQNLSLSSAGEQAFAVLDRRSHEEVAEMLAGLSEAEQQQLLKAMRAIQSILDKGQPFKFSEPFFLRQPEPGDMGWIVHRHGVLYAQEYGWNEEFEALVAQIVADFVKNYQPSKERCWIAEIEGEIVGSVFLVQAGESVAKLRLLLVEPKARGLGLGARLVEACIRFARQAGYRKLTLWTNNVLLAARHIYAKKGFRCVAEETYYGFGQDLVSETWELDL